MNEYVVKTNVEPWECLLALDVAYAHEGIPEDEGCLNYMIIAPEGVGDDVALEFFPDYIFYSDVYTELFIDNYELVQEIIKCLGDMPYEFDVL
jgi:hypothetical protein